MPLEKEYSIVADSTGSSPPPPTMDAPLQVKKVTRTYGRRREEPQAGDAATSSLQSENRSLTRNSVHNTAPPGLLDEVPPSSPREHVADTASGRRVNDEDEDEESTSVGESKFSFGWKDKLRALDEDDDEDADMLAVSKFDDAPSKSTFGQPLLLQGTANTFLSPNTPTERKASPKSTLIADNVFSPDPFSTKTATPRGATPQLSFSLSSPSSPLPLISRGRIRKAKAVIHDSDSELELPKDSSSTTASGSSKQKSRSSSTPPTSEDEMPAQIRLKSQSAAKRKSAASSRASVQPLQFTEDPASEIKKGNVINKKGKIKASAPTNKEKEEMVKERGRLAAQSAVSIPRTETTSKYSKDYLFAKISGKQGLNQQPSTSKVAPPISDPIISFSSPVKDRPVSPELDASRSHSPRHQKSLVSWPVSPENHDSGEDSDLPDIGKVLTTSMREDTRKKELMEAKKRALAQQKRTKVDDNDDDDDLEIVQSNAKVAVKEEETHRRSLHKRPSEGRKRQLQLAQINPTKQAAKVESPVRRTHHGESTLSMFQQGGSLNTKKLNQILAAEVQKNAQLEMKKKEAEWQKHGGRIGGNPEAHAKGLTSVVQTLAERGLQVAENRSAGQPDIDMDEDEDQSDEDWDPALRGSASPEPTEEGDEDVDGEREEGDQEEREEGNQEAEEEENDENVPLKGDANMVDDFGPLDDEGSNVRPTCRMVITSDSEGEEADKENDTKLMYDRSEDKENTAVVRHEPLTLAPRSLFLSNSVASPPLSPSTQAGNWGARSQASDFDDDHPPNRRRPLKELISEESPTSTQTLATNLTQSFTAKLQQASPLPSTLAPAPTLKPLFSVEGSSSGDLGGFSQFSQAHADIFGPAPSLQPGFSDLFESATEKQKSTAGTSEKTLSNDKNLRRLKRTDTLGLTQDFSALNKLQPAFQAGDNLLRKADAIFEKEQDFVVEAAKNKEQNGPDLYVNDNGFLTQTRPADGSPEIYRPSSAQNLYSIRRAPLLTATQPSSRAPLRTLSIASSFPESPTQPSPRLRLQRLAHTPPPMNVDGDSPEPPPKALNAFDVLAGAAQKLKKRDEHKSRPDLSAYLENEAAESDDEDAFGFAKPKNAEDDEGGEDLDATLEELMDDKELDESAIASDLVHAKFMEQLEVEDQENEKFHQGVIKGEQRTKRRRGVEVDDSDEDSDMEDNEKARRAMKKLRKSDRGDIKTLEENEATRAFAEAYNQTLKDDDTEFLYLEQETTFEDIVKDRMQVDESQDSEDDEEENNEPETISHDEIIRQIRQNKGEGIEDTGVDLRDVSWVDQEEEEEAPRVKTVNTRVRPKARLQATSEQSEMDTMGAAFRKPANPSTSSSSKLWYAQEHKSRNAGTSRSVGGSAITGHAKAKSKTGNGTVRAGSMAKRSATASSSSTSTGSKTVKAAPSMLSVISDKSRHFA